jgi:hypothetical protein
MYNSQKQENTKLAQRRKTAKLPENEMRKACRKQNDVKSYITSNYLITSRYIYNKNMKEKKQ